VIRFHVDCDADTLLFEVEQTGGACHTGHQSCFFQEVDRDGQLLEVSEAPVFNAGETYASKN
jgi:hypothetical protein